MHQLAFRHTNTSWPYVDYTARVEFPDGVHQLQIQATWDGEQKSGYISLMLDDVDWNNLANVDIVTGLGIDQFMKMVGHDPRPLLLEGELHAEKAY